MKHCLVNTLIVAALLGSFATACFAQRTLPSLATEDDGWFSLGFGRGSPYELSGVASTNFGSNRFWQVVLNGTGVLSWGGRAATVNSLSVGYGYSVVNRVGRVAISAGAGPVWGRKDSGEPGARLTNFVTGGIVPNLQVMLTPIKELGLGLDFYSAINPRKTVGGLRLVLVVEGYK